MISAIVCEFSEGTVLEIALEYLYRALKRLVIECDCIEAKLIIEDIRGNQKIEILCLVVGLCSITEYYAIEHVSVPIYRSG